MASEVSYRTVLVMVVLIVLAAFLISPVKQLLDEAQANRQLHEQIEQEKARQQQLKDQIAQWDDPDYVAAQARERLGYLKPGQTQFVVVDPSGRFVKPKQEQKPLEGPAKPWFLKMGQSLDALSGQVPTVQINNQK